VNRNHQVGFIFFLFGFLICTALLAVFAKLCFTGFIDGWNFHSIIVSFIIAQTVRAGVMVMEIGLGVCSEDDKQQVGD
jgi:hypothetical protein